MYKKSPKYIEGEKWKSTLGEIVPDSRLLEKHPELRDLKVEYIFDESTHASHHYNQKRILIYAPNQKSFNKVLQHEVEHRVQESKSGPDGTSVDYRGVEGTPAHKWAIKQYRKNPGEVLARKAEAIPFEEYFQLPGFELRLTEEKSGLLKRLASKLFVGLVILTLVSYTSLTGNAISNSTTVNFSWIGIVLITLTVGFIWWKNKK